MEYENRQWVHLAGIVVVFAILYMLFNYFHLNKPRGGTLSMQGYVWLATVNKFQPGENNNNAIHRGDASMLVIRQADMVRFQRRVDNIHRYEGDPHALSLMHAHHEHDALIDKADPLYSRLFFVTVMHDRYRVVPLADSPIRAIQVHRQGPNLVFHAVFTNGRIAPMGTAPQRRVYSPMLRR